MAGGDCYLIHHNLSEFPAWTVESEDSVDRWIIVPKGHVGTEACALPGIREQSLKENSSWLDFKLLVLFSSPISLLALIVQTSR